jgi:hypothetical protein
MQIELLSARRLKSRDKGASGRIKRLINPLCLFHQSGLRQIKNKQFDIIIILSISVIF